MNDLSSWVIRFRENPNARFRLFCFPFAGGGASAYSRWPERLPQEIDLLALQYPGRETRWLDPPISDAAALAEGIVSGISPMLDEMPFAFFGHSLGAMMSFEVARLLRTAHRPEPARLFLSGRRAPPYPGHPPAMTGLSEEEFRRQLGELNGTPAAVLENEELMSLLMPMLRADFKLDETYRYQEGAPLWQDFSIFGGEDDFRVPHAQLKAWENYTTGKAAFELFPGDHFYLKDPGSRVFTVLSGELRHYL